MKVGSTDLSGVIYVPTLSLEGGSARQWPGRPGKRDTTPPQLELVLTTPCYRSRDQYGHSLMICLMAFFLFISIL
jgi:hypothetical protein